jgi:hypothetical protein
LTKYSLESNKETLLFFSPFSGNWKAALAEHQVMKSLSKDFHVVDVRCEEYFHEFCTVMNAKRLDISSEERMKKSICQGCITNKSLLKSKRVKTKTVPKSLFVDEEFNQLQISIADLDVPELFSQKFRNLEIGRIGIFESIIKYKKINFQFEPIQLLHFRTKMLHASKSILIAEEILKGLKPKAIFIFSPEYAVTGAFAEYGISKGFRVYGVHFTANANEIFQTLQIFDWEKFKLRLPALEYWDTGQVSVSESGLARVGKHLPALRDPHAAFVYSSQKSGASIRKNFGIPVGNKLVLLAMNSYDEVFANFTSGLSEYDPTNGRVFKNQIEWVRKTIDFFEQLEGVSLVIRPHPREFPNKRDSVKSEHVKLWESLFSRLPSNVYLDSPDQKNSVFDHFSEIDCLITGWSAVGLEGMLHGIPCVTFDEKLPPFPPSIHFSGSSVDEYFKNLLLGIGAGRSEKIRADANRWAAYNWVNGSVRTSGQMRDFPIVKNIKFLRRAVDFLGTKYPKYTKLVEARIGWVGNDRRKLINMIHNGNDSFLEVRKTEVLS